MGMGIVLFLSMISLGSLGHLWLGSKSQNSAFASQLNSIEGFYAGEVAATHSFLRYRNGLPLNPIIEAIPLLPDNFLGRRLLAGGLNRKVDPQNQRSRFCGAASLPGGAVREVCLTRQRAELATCSDLSRVRTANYPLVFPSTSGQRCEWGGNGNLPLDSDSGNLQARREQTASFTIPPGAAICSIEIDSGSSQSVRYDDYLFILFEDFFFAEEGHKFMDMRDWGMESVGNLVKYRWEPMIGHRSTSYPTLPRGMCPIGGSCTIPPTETMGRLQIHAPTSWFAELPPAVAAQSTFSMKVVVAGNRTDTDCQHTGFNLTARVTYAQ